MKNPKTTTAAILLAVAALVSVVAKYLLGEAPDWMSVTTAVTTLLGAFGLYKAVDPGNGGTDVK